MDDPREFENFLKSRDAWRECPACGEVDWLVLPDSYGLHIVDAQGQFVAEFVGGRKALKGSVVAGVVCRTCAFIRFHSPEVLRVVQDTPRD